MPFTVWKQGERNRHSDRKTYYYDFLNMLNVGLCHVDFFQTLTNFSPPRKKLMSIHVFLAQQEIIFFVPGRNMYIVHSMYTSVYLGFLVV